MCKLSNLAKAWKMKRGRGRPRKNSMTSDLSNTQNSYLEEGNIGFVMLIILKLK